MITIQMQLVANDFHIENVDLGFYVMNAIATVGLSSILSLWLYDLWEEKTTKERRQSHFIYGVFTFFFLAMGAPTYVAADITNHFSPLFRSITMTIFLTPIAITLTRASLEIRKQLKSGELKKPRKPAEMDKLIELTDSTSSDSKGNKQPNQ